MGNFRLLSESIPAVIVSQIGGKSRVEPIHEPEWAIVKRIPQNRHVVRVHDPMNEAHRLPLSNQGSGFVYHLTEQKPVFFVLMFDLRKVALNDVIS